MAWRNQTYIVATLFLQGKHNMGQFDYLYFSAITILTDLIVLAEDAAQVTI